ncbi:hypothetical protein GCM10011487_12630 [Steroidobacter agaridevorans]|uniref:Uncharacterized protein n=1 Tax=Steroidobacter agaridevorans TaxID=2695856 RepID=A0A829Y8A0_9GAMM|nr:hypothetical protein GCM10011487_12630 [Steroidobacter agaridevorans]
MVACILARISRGRLLLRVINAVFLTFAWAVAAWAAVAVDPLGIVEPIDGEAAAPELTLVGGGVA